MSKERRANNTAGTIAAVAAVVLVGLWAVSALTLGSASAGPPISPHLPAGPTTDTCAACHRSHTGQNDNLLESGAPQATVCFSCHDGTGANYNVAAEYNDLAVPPNNAATSSFYSHPALNDNGHVSAKTSEFAGVLNRHSACADCHNPHTLNAGLPAHTGSGWTASGALAGISGVSNTLAWTNPITYEYELCYKCHSGYTGLLSYSKESYKKTDKAAEFDPSTASYHPVEAPGKNTTPQLQQSLNGGKLWQFTTGSTVRCTNCHGNYRLVGNPPTPNNPAQAARLAPHASVNRGLLIANYRDRDLKPRNEAYRSTDFTLCYLCHSEAPFTDQSGNSRSDTNFRYHGKHLAGIGDGPTSASLDIDTLGGGQGNAICAECHFRVHGTVTAPWPANQDYGRGVNFAPDVRPLSGEAAPLWSLANKTCTLICHSQQHTNENY